MEEKSTHPSGQQNQLLNQQYIPQEGDIMQEEDIMDIILRSSMIAESRRSSQNSYTSYILGDEEEYKSPVGDELKEFGPIDTTKICQSPQNKKSSNIRLIVGGVFAFIIGKLLVDSLRQNDNTSISLATSLNKSLNESLSSIPDYGITGIGTAIDLQRVPLNLREINSRASNGVDDNSCLNIPAASKFKTEINEVTATTTEHQPSIPHQPENNVYSNIPAASKFKTEINEVTATTAQHQPSIPYQPENSNVYSNIPAASEFKTEINEVTATTAQHQPSIPHQPESSNVYSNIPAASEFKTEINEVTATTAQHQPSIPHQPENNVYSNIPAASEFKTEINEVTAATTEHQPSIPHQPENNVYSNIPAASEFKTEINEVTATTAQHQPSIPHQPENNVYSNIPAASEFKTEINEVTATTTEHQPSIPHQPESSNVYSNIPAASEFKTEINEVTATTTEHQPNIPHQPENNVYSNIPAASEFKLEINEVTATTTEHQLNIPHQLENNDKVNPEPLLPTTKVLEKPASLAPEVYNNEKAHRSPQFITNIIDSKKSERTKTPRDNEQVKTPLSEIASTDQAKILDIGTVYRRVQNKAFKEGRAINPKAVSNEVHSLYSRIVDCLINMSKKLINDIAKNEAHISQCLGFSIFDIFKIALKACRHSNNAIPELPEKLVNTTNDLVQGR